MKIKFCKLMLVVISALVLVSMFTSTAFAYNYDFVKTYRDSFWNSKNPTFFKYVDNDCTNYASQVAAFSGMPSWIDWNSGLLPEHYNLATTAPSLRYAVDDNASKWYSITDTTKKLGITYTYHIYSRSWTITTDFKNFMKTKSSYVTVTTYAQNKKAEMLAAAKVGDIIQLDGKHTIIIVRKDSNTKLFYTQHTVDRKEEDIATFTTWAASSSDGRKDKSFILFHYK